MILVAYDGSSDAQGAIDRAAELMPGAEATVLTVWEPFSDTVARSGAMGGIGMGYGWAGTYADSEKMDAVSQAAAEATAAKGAERAVAAGLDAKPRSATRSGSEAFTILAAAEDAHADLIVVGTRGLGGLKSFLLGSVSHAVLQHADRAVVVVPSPALADHRRDRVPQSAASAPLL
jgi:nucleotide-binding universal stress UspA family protein